MQNLTRTITILICLPLAFFLIGSALVNSITQTIQPQIKLEYIGWLELEDGFNKNRVPEYYQALSSTGFEPVTPRGYDTRHYAALAEITNTGSRHETALLSFRSTTLDNIHIFEIKNTGPSTVIDSLYDYQITDRSTYPIEYRKPVFPFEISNSDKKRILLIAQGDGSLDLAMDADFDSVFWQEEMLSFGVHMLFFGIMLVMIFYNLILSLITSYQDYAIYSVYVLFNLLLQVSLSGHGKMFLFMEIPWLLHNGQMTFAAGACISGGIFLLRLLDVRDLSSRLYVVSIAIIGGWFSVLTLSFWFSEAGLWLLHVPLSIVSFCYVWFVAVLAHFRGNRLALPFLVAWFALLVGGCVFVLRVAGILPTNWITQYSLQIGVSVEVTLLSMVLAMRIRLQKIDSLNELVEMKNDFLGTVSHELRTPINGILGNTEMMLATKPCHTQESMLHDIRKSAWSIRKVIENILIYTEASSGTLKRDEIVFDIKKRLNALEDNYRAQAESKGLNFSLHIYENVDRWVVGDEPRMTLVLTSLLDNAIEYTPNGKVSVFCYLTPQKNNEYIEFITVIQDSGVGIDPGSMDKIFQLFTQGDSRYNRKHGGLGIGLAVCKEVTSLLGGEIRFTSEPGEGSTFVVNLPLKRTTKTHHTEKKSNPRKLDRLPELLIVEDNPVNQRVLVAMTKKLGLTADLANNGLEAVEQCEIKQYDFIFMDCQMPVMDGFEATEKIRQLEGYDNCIIVAVTANATSRDKQHCLDSGMNAHIAKPVKLQMIRDSLTEWLTFPGLERTDNE